MSMRGTDMPAYNPSLPDSEKEKVIQESLRQIRQAFGSTGMRNLVGRNLTQAVALTGTVPTIIGALSSAFQGTQGFTRIAIRVPFSLSGGATSLSLSLWLDGVEVDRESGTAGALMLEWSGTPSDGNHVVQVKGQVNAGAASLFDAGRWGKVTITETLL